MTWRLVFQKIGDPYATTRVTVIGQKDHEFIGIHKVREDDELYHIETTEEEVQSSDTTTKEVET